MIKLEATGNLPTAASILRIKAQGNAPAISLSVADAWKPSEDDFVKDESKRKQVVSYINEDGRTCELIGPVEEAAAIQMPGAHQVVVLVTFKLDKRSGQMRIVISRIVEVWSTPSKKLWHAPDWSENRLSGPSMDPVTGKIGAAA